MGKDCGYCITVIYSRKGSQASTREAPTEVKNTEEEKKASPRGLEKMKRTLLEHTDVSPLRRSSIKKASGWMVPGAW